MPAGRLPIAASDSATVTIDGRELVLFAGCDYLGLAHHPRVIAALQHGSRAFGVSSAGSRETTGNSVAHDELERDLARFLDVEAALLVPDGYLSNLIFAQAMPDDIARVLVDAESHVSMRDAIAASGRAAIEYRFVDASDARERATGITSEPFAIFTDGVFPVMRGEAPLPALLELLPRDGVLVVDDCHGVGVRGARGRGSVERHGLRDPRIVITGTLSKALGCFGGFIAGSRSHIERTRERSRAYVGSTPIPPALAHAGSEALRVLEAEPERRERLQQHVLALRVAFQSAGRAVSATPFPVFTFQLDSHEAMEAAYETLFAEGLLVPYVNYPDSMGGYFRLAVRADHTREQIERLVRALQTGFRPMKPRPFDDVLLTTLAREHGTPLWVYDAETIRMRIRDLERFDVVRYAQKANSNLAILDLVRRAGGELDAVSAGEIARGLAAGFAPEQIVFTADLFDARAIDAIVKHKVPVNLGSHFMIEQYARIRPGGEVTLRVNPGFGHGHARKVNTGGETSKHGIWHAQIPDVIALAHRHDLRVRGLHVHIGSGSDFENLARVRDAVKTIARAAGTDLAVISAGGGLPIPYRADEPVFDVARFSDAWLEMREEIERDLGRKMSIEVEPGRYLVAESGCLLTQVRGTKRSGKYDYVFVDAGFNTLIRPAMYGAYHQISAVGRAQAEYTHAKIVAGPLCESADVFTQGHDGVLAPQLLPDVGEGDLLCIHDAGAYGAAMSSNYNSQPFAAEILVENGAARLIRRRQTLDELLAPESGL